MHRAQPPPEGSLKQATVVWEGVASVDDWLRKQPVSEWKQFFDKNGYVKVDGLLEGHEVAKYADIYTKMLDRTIDTSAHRHDLGNHMDTQKAGVENICQIMWPSLYVHGFEADGASPLHARALAVARVLLGDDIAFDFDMLISKPAHSPAETPWHQDQGYWPDMDDKRAVSCWVAIDEATEQNGCMWFVPGSHHKLREHQPVAAGKHVLTCEVDKSEGVCVPLSAGSCTLHHGATAHHTRPNTTSAQRRAYIINARPAAMVEYERQLGYDHGRKGLTNVLGNTKSHSDK